MENILLRDLHMRVKSQVSFENKYYYLPRDWILDDFTETMQLEMDELT